MSTRIEVVESTRTKRKVEEKVRFEAQGPSRRTQVVVSARIERKAKAKARSKTQTKVSTYELRLRQPRRLLPM